MSIEQQIHEQLEALGMHKGGGSHELERLGLALTVCQFIVVVLSIISIVFLFAPLFFLRDITFMLVFFGLSLLCLIVGIWFWLKKSEICEHPEEYA